MGWHKINLVTNKDMTDTWGCDECGFKRNYRLGEGRSGCPQCMKKKSAGWWTQDVGYCGICGERGKLVPKTGHVLSEYWKLKRHKNEKLYYCPYGCLDGDSAKYVIKKLRKEIKELKKRKNNA